VSHLDLDDVRLFYTDEGAGPPVLLVHGYTADSHDWSWQIPHLVGSSRVVAVDLRGHGASSSPAGGYTAEVMADDLARLVAHLGIAPVVAFGHSMGANIVSVLAVEHPGSVSAIVAVDPAYLVDDDLVGDVGALLDAVDDDGLVQLVQGIVRDAMQSPARDIGLRTWQVRRVATMAPHVLRQTLLVQTAGLALRSKSEPYLRRREVPVLSFHADPARAALEDEVFTDERSRTVSWEGSGHWLHQERPAELNAIVTDWLASLA
jgi:pimeloyl-ACP methyl ester carboxylesterase